MENKQLCFIKYVGENTEEKKIYELLFTNNIDEFWGENFEYMPCCLVNELIPDENGYDEVYELVTNLKLTLIQQSCCNSFQDCIDGIIALGYEDISDYEEYPEEGRVVLHYGYTLEEVEEMLSAKGDKIYKKEN